jgi:hypothetical protein
MNVRADAAVTTCALALVLAMPVPLAGEDSLTAARQLYASAEYRGALSMLSNLLAGNPPSQDRQSLELYRTLCFVALGNVAEATAVIETMLVREPLYRPSPEETPPRVRTLFTESRKRLLPSLIQQRYVLAKADFDRRDYQTAAAGFSEVLLALSDPDLGQAAGDAPLADLRVLAMGFNELAVRLMSEPSQAAVPMPSQAAGPIVPPLPAPAPPISPSREPDTYTTESSGIVPPIALKQDLPPFPGRVRAARTGVLDIVIDATGAVESAELFGPFDATYNRLVQAAVKSWAFQPARLDGAPVRFRKKIQIVVSPEP